MPGYLPFAGALDLPAFFCDNCGFWQRSFAPPPACPLCLDARHVVPQKGWRFHDRAAAEARYPCHWAEYEPGVWRFWNDPVNGIGSSGYLIRTASGNMMFEGCAVYSVAALEQIRSLGGVSVLAASHPHSYGALWQIQDAFDPELALHPGDLAWSGAVSVTWPFDETLEPLPGLSCTHGRPLRRAHGAVRPRAGILFCGDALKFELDPGRSPPRAHHLGPQGVRARHPAHAERTAPLPARCSPALDFVQTWTPFEQVRNAGRREALALIDAMLATRPHAVPVPLSELG